MTLVNMAHYLLQAKFLSTKIWIEAIYCANYVMNLVLTCVVSSMTPIENWCGNKPLVGHLKKFQFVVWEHSSDAYRRKVDVRSHV